MKPAAHPSAQVPLTLLHVLLKQFPQVSLQFWPYMPFSHTRQELNSDYYLMDTDYNS